jgi:predicted restriction endonuclease
MPKSKISKQGSISAKRRTNYKKPNETERKGLVTSRVGQGYYRQQIIEKWDGKCAISKTDILPILIASHIVSWSESNDDERLDVENGILLSPLYDALFDKHLISFDATGGIIISDALTHENLTKLGLSKDTRIQITEGMLPYLAKHFSRMAAK